MKHYIKLQNTFTMFSIMT